jgi:hypothetical protein
MVNVNYDGVSYSIKSDVNELTIGEYEKINYYLNNDGDFFDKWFSILEYLGLPKTIIDDIDANELIEIVKSINISEVEPVFRKEIEISGYLYTCELKENGEPKITGKTFKLLEKACKKDYYIADILAILFKRSDLSDKEHFDKSHLDYKATLFRELEASICVPYVLFIADRYVKNIMSLK